MTTIKGRKFLTVYAESAEIYDIDYGTAPKLNIFNYTDGDIKIGSDSSFPDNTGQTAGLFITLPSGTAVNDIAMPFGTVYIRSSESGNIVIERCG